MQFIELIKYLTKQEQLDELIQKQGLNTETEALLIYLKGGLYMESEAIILEIEKTEDALVYEKEGIQYFQLFPLNYAIELIEYDLDMKDKGHSDLDIGRRLLEYRQKDS